MKHEIGSLLGRVALRFDEDAEHVPEDLSAAARTASGSLLLAADERGSIELLVAGDNPRIYEHKRTDSLQRALGLDADVEIDIEGLCTTEGDAALLVVGSHSAKRKKPKGQGVDKDLARLATVEVDDARFVLARVSLSDKHKVRDDVALVPRVGEGSLVQLLADDPHLGPFMPCQEERFIVPGKDNGFDVEGLALFHDRLLIGLRGPVLRGWAFILELELSEPTPGTLELGARGKHRYRKHALHLDGLGIRDLLVHGDDLLIMAGPTMALDGVHRVYRWCGGPHKGKDSLVEQERGVLEPMFEVPYAKGGDRAEGMTLHSWFAEEDSLLVVYDSPSAARRPNEKTVLADVFSL